MKAGNVTVGVRLRVVLDRDIALGPGKADLLETIGATGSISAAARGMGMSYKRAWLLVDTMNRCFQRAACRIGEGRERRRRCETDQAGRRGVAPLPDNGASRDTRRVGRSGRPQALVATRARAALIPENFPLLEREGKTTEESPYRRPPDTRGMLARSDQLSTST